VRRALTATCVLLAAQGAVGGLQYLLELPAELVWIHVALAATTWLALLWSTLAAGRVGAPSGEPVRAAPAAERVPVSTA
jgi:cytochrome c oxidase assembly protein subunit 15